MPLAPLGGLSAPDGVYRSFQILQEHGGMRLHMPKVLRQVLFISAESKFPFLSSVGQIFDEGKTPQIYQ